MYITFERFLLWSVASDLHDWTIIAATTATAATAVVKVIYYGIILNTIRFQSVHGTADAPERRNQFLWHT